MIATNLPDPYAEEEEVEEHDATNGTAVPEQLEGGS